ncbi:uncharacterized protein TNCV_3635581 [Trichonephila clavipes]|nr:uncharacterized protein TNCV_3635581 [Trichonephila clavipes]
MIFHLFEKNVIEEVVDLARQINLEVDRDDVQELLDSHNHELTTDDRGVATEFFQKVSVMSRRKQRSAFDQVFEFDRGRIMAYRDCVLSFREIGSRVGRNQTTLMRIGDSWMQNGTTD